MFLRKFFAMAGTLRKIVGRVSRMLTGMFLAASIALRPACTEASAAPLIIIM